MADEVRRSGRANKGHHTKNAEALDEPLPKPKPKQKTDKKAQPQPQAPPQREQSVQSGDQQEEEDAIIRCVCGDQRDIRGRQMICCDKCEVWQHNKCLGLPEGDYWEDKTYYCERCKPEDHKELLAAMERGEKPWNRKKGSKAKPKARPSDVKSETEPEKQKTATPQPVQAPPSTIVQPSAATATTTTTAAAAAAAATSGGSGGATSGAAAVASPAQTPAPTPTPVPKEVPPESSNGHAEPKSRKDTPKSQPQSPLGEKRRHESANDKDSTNKKRRKSSQHQDKVDSQATVTDVDGLPEKQRLMAEKLRDSLIPLINGAAETRGYRIPDGATAKSIATKLTLQIDHAAIIHYGEPSNNQSPYYNQLRSIMFNAKKNAVLVDRLLSTSLTAEEIASMAAEEMASEEKQREYAAMREANEKQMVLTAETGPRLRKTHKGEEIVGDDEVPTNHDFRPTEPRERETQDEKPPPPQSPSRDGQTMVELPEDVSNQAPLSVDTSNAPPESIRRPSTNFDINSVFDKVRSPQNDQQVFLQRRQSSIRAQEKAQGPVDDADVDRLLKDEDNDVEMAGYSADPTVVWQGTLDMQSLGPFDAVARFVAGGDFGQVVPWDQLLSPKLPIQGRIESQKGDEYIRGLATSGSHDVGVLAINPVTTKGRGVMDHLYSYFRPRDRWGVVPVDKLGNDTMRDLYVIPIEPGGTNLPPFLDMLEYCTIETPRKEYMILLALIAKLPEVKSQLPATQNSEQYPGQDVAAGQTAHPSQPVNGPTNGPSPSPVNPHGPQYSPVSAAFPPGQSFPGPHPSPANNGHPQQMPPNNLPPHHQIPKALDIFGPYIDCPVIVQLLNGNPVMTETQMDNLRYIVEHVPQARNDIRVLSEHMTQRSASNGQS